MPIYAEIIIRFLFYAVLNALDILQFIIFIAVMLSWFRPKNNAFIVFIKRIAFPILRLAQRITPRLGAMDFSPIVALLGIGFLRSGVFSLFNYLF